MPTYDKELTATEAERSRCINIIKSYFSTTSDQIMLRSIINCIKSGQDYPLRGADKEAKHHVAVAASFKTSSMYCKLYITASDDRYTSFNLEEREFSVVESQWFPKMTRLTAKEAKDIIAAGVAEEWMGCVSKSPINI